MVKKTKPVPPDEHCNARTRAGTLCKRKAGTGTDHLGTGRCKLHGGVTGDNHGPPKGSQNAKQHGIYARLFKQDELDAAAEMAGSIDSELAIARLQLVRLHEQKKLQGDIAYLDVVEEKTIATDDDSEEQSAKIKKARAKDADRCGEYYDPEDDDFNLPDKNSESGVIERKKVYKRRDWSTEENRLNLLIAKLEGQRLVMQLKQIELENARKGGTRNGNDDTSELTDEELDSVFSGIIED